MKTLYIHIGDAKTGSSTIQQFLTAKRNEHLDLGFDYIRIGLLANQGIAQHELAFAVNKDKVDFHSKKAQLYDKLNELIINSSCNNFIISSEGFCSLRSIEEVTELKRLLPSQVRVKIIIYLRRPDTWIESWYAQVVKNIPFTSATFDEFLSRHQEPAFKVLLNYAKIFSCKDILVRAFDNKAFFKNNLISDFCNELGLPIVNEVKLNDENVSPNSDCIQTLRLLNEKLDMDSPSRVALYKQIMANFKYSVSPPFLSDKQRAEVIARYKPEIQEIEREVIDSDNSLRLLYEN
jgi:hypothetical protein